MLADSPVVPYVGSSDLDRSRRFYEDVIGAKEIQRMGVGSLYQCGEGSQFFLYKTQYAGTSGATLLNWTVTDIRTAVDDLLARGVEFEHYDFPELKDDNGVHTSADGHVQNAWFKDPDGNILSVLQAG